VRKSVAVVNAFSPAKTFACWNSRFRVFFLAGMARHARENRHVLLADERRLYNPADAQDRIYVRGRRQAFVTLDEQGHKQTDVTYTAVRQALGREWETALKCVAEEESRLKTFDERQPVLPSLAQLEQPAHWGEDLRRLWNHPRASNSMEQQLVRVLIQEIVADVDEQRDEAILLIQWSGGQHTQLRARRTL
jgi:hypothetical protein